LNWPDAPAFAWVWVDNVTIPLYDVGSGRPDRDGRRAAHHESIALRDQLGLIDLHPSDRRIYL